MSRSTALRALSVAASLSFLAAAIPAPAAGPPVAELRAVSALPPGNSGFYPVSGQLQGTVTGKPADFGTHVDDQRDLYWSNKFKPAGFTKNGIPEQPKTGVSIYRDPFGVASVYGTNSFNTWFGAGYAAAQDRLFEMDAVRRLGEGRLAELTGNGGVPGDVATRIQTYTDAEYAAMFAALPAASQEVVLGYVDGVNAWITKVRTDPLLLPAEYVLLSSLPEAWTVKDTLAAGVLITRSVAAEGGNEMAAVAALAELKARFGAVAGQGVFTDLYWREDPKAATTIPASGGRFDNNDTPVAQRGEAFLRMAAYAGRIPAALANGAGTGAYPAPAAVGVPSGQVTGGTGAGTGSGIESGIARAARALTAWGRQLHGGSYQWAVSGARSATGKPLLESAPQLGWTFPSELWEVEVHGGGYDARGATVPGLPAVGIGYGKRVAWALTTGYSKTVDSFIETTRTVNGVKQYLHNGRWRNEDCRSEKVFFRVAANGAPAGPALRSITVPVCRTVHGPVVATTSDGSRERSVQYAMWKVELDTVNGVLAWDRAQNLAQFAAGVSQVTWNENVMYADADGHIGYWHPGRYPRRAVGVDERFPTPGTGAYDWRGWRPFAEMPHIIDPAQGFLANWNNKPAVGWSSGEAFGTEGGPDDHQQVVADLLKNRHGMTFADLVAIDRAIGSTDARWRSFKPLVLALRRVSGLSAMERGALEILAHWDGSSFGPGAGTSPDLATDGPAPTIFAALVTALRSELFAALPADLYARATHVNLHLYDITRLDAMVLRVLRPETSGLVLTRDYTGHRTRDAVVQAALDDALAALASKFGGTDLAGYRRAHPVTVVCSLTGVIGPACTNEPYEDRGSYIHLVSLGG